MVYCDNKPAVQVFQRYWSTNLEWAPYLIYRSNIMYEEDCIIDVLHIPGKLNIFADALSRGKMATFNNICHIYNKPKIQRIHPTYIPNI